LTGRTEDRLFVSAVDTNTPTVPGADRSRRLRRTGGRPVL